jgi:hypothetical protein
MQIPSFLEKNKIIISGVVGAIVFIGIGYWFIFVFLNSEKGATTATIDTTAAAKLLPKNMVQLSDALNKDKVSLSDKSFLESYFVTHAKDYTTYVPTSTSRGRYNPFAPYDSTGSSR